MNVSEYLIFRQTLSHRRYRVPVDYEKTAERVVTPANVVKQLRNSTRGLKNFTCFVSGGVDSSMLAAISGAKVIYTATFPGYEEHDESEWAYQVADHIGAELRTVPIDRGEYLASLEHLIRHKGDGLHPNEPCLYLVAKRAAKDGFETILSGEGADDIFGGYTDLLEHGDEYLKDQASFLRRYAYVRPHTQNLSEEIDIGTYRKWGMERFILEVHTVGLIERAANACEAAGINPLFPYLMGELPQMMWQAPRAAKTGKKLLKETAEAYLPKEIIYRPKIGFPVPLDDWLGSPGIENFLLLNTRIWRSFN